MPEVSLADDDAEWRDVILPDGALKSNMLKGLIGFQELEVKPTKAEKRKRKAAILFDESANSPSTPQKQPKTDLQKRKRKQRKKKEKKVLEEKMEEVEEKVTTEEYVFKNKMHLWSRMNLAKCLLRILDEKDYVTPTPIQSATVPKGLNSKNDVLAAAETGSGKTFAFGLPVIQKIEAYLEKFGEYGTTEEVKVQLEEGEGDDDEGVFGEVKRKEGPMALVLCPTRELACQVHDQIKLLCTYTKVRSGVIIGGMSDDKQERVLSKHKPHIVVATPGRFWELVQKGQCWLQSLDLVKYLVIDEADRMAEKGHFQELGGIVGAIGQCQKFVFSATLTLTHKGSKRMQEKNVKADTAQQKAKKLMKALSIDKGDVVDLSNKQMTASALEEFKVACGDDREKDAWLYWLLARKQGRAIVFVNAISAALRLNGLLAPLGLNTHSLHSNMQQRARLKHLDRFRQDSQATLVSTDVAARGLDIPNVEMIIHFQFPKTAETYVHRSGRAARAGNSGQAIVLLGQADNANFKKVMNNLNKPELSSWVSSQPTREVYDRLKLASKIDKMSHDRKKQTVEKNWFKEPTYQISFL